MYASLLNQQEPYLNNTSTTSTYVTSFGSKNAPNKIDIFYGIECGFSREFLQQDFKILLEEFTLKGKAFIQLYPAALDPTTITFAEMIYTSSPHGRRKMFMQLCNDNSYYHRLFSKASIKKPSEKVFFDVAKILEENESISETLMIKVNGTLLMNVPSTYALEEVLQVKSAVVLAS